MTKPIIEVKNVGKRYRIGANKEPYLSLRDEIVKWFSPKARRAKAEQSDFWALKDVSFSVQEGEAVGIIGRNGAGKSTLLKILSQITPPTVGEVTMRGRVASLLEVGTGFHPELTGRENIYLNGAILGMTRGEIKRKFDEIVAFAEIEKFLDTPVKRYSSGMYVRLAFAVAAHLEPEILVVDEVLAVGDAEFQKKCLGKMGAVTSGGRTVLFVSHNMAAIQSLCNKAIVLSFGKIISNKPISLAINDYVASCKRQNSADLNNYTVQKKQGIFDVWIQNINGEKISELLSGDAHEICISYKIEANNTQLRFALVFYNNRGEVLFCCDTHFSANSFESNASKGIAKCYINKSPLVNGDYYLNASIQSNLRQVDFVERACEFTVLGGDYYGTGKIPHSRYGSFLIDYSWKYSNL
jgi:lipopolysaccharide transport system ATP-binding protein